MGRGPNPPRFYSTKVKASRSANEILELLAEHGSEHQHVVHRAGRPAGVYFTIPTPELEEPIPVRLEPQTEAIRVRLEASDKNPSAAGDPEDIAWRLLKWTVEVKLEQVANNQATPFTAFLADTMTAEGDTVGEAILEHREGLLPSGRLALMPGE